MKEMRILGRCPKCNYLLTQDKPICPRCGIDVTGKGAGIGDSGGVGREWSWSWWSVVELVVLGLILFGAALLGTCMEVLDLNPGVSARRAVVGLCLVGVVMGLGGIILGVIGYRRREEMSHWGCVVIVVSVLGVCMFAFLLMLLWRS